ncbi:unnamed protein product [Nezara viridula]|uniref:Neuropeptide n=1 Tax=Nezara viridula TaxID=85310 RepID=A0A9P0HRF2_NEZVI|nr:unnamed protein product [Nezara viridula]
MTARPKRLFCLILQLFGSSMSAASCHLNRSASWVPSLRGVAVAAANRLTYSRQSHPATSLSLRFQFVEKIPKTTVSKDKKDQM